MLAVKEKIPGTIKDEMFYLSRHSRDWSQIRHFSSSVANKHGFRFLLVSWYAGEEYKQKINSAIKQLDKLQRNHEDEVQFLDEVYRRCYYAFQEYYFETGAILEEILKMNFFEISDPFELIENAFWFNFRENTDLMSLEVGLVSETVSKRFDKELLTREPPTAGEKIVSPYDLIKSEEYAKMKIHFMNAIERKTMIKNLLVTFSNFLKEWGCQYSLDFYRDPKRYYLKIQDLIGKLELGKNDKSSICSPVLNFRFFVVSVEDFSAEPLVENFLRFRTETKKRKWLQNCLSLGLPLFPNIPFGKLGFEVKNIL